MLVLLAVLGVANPEPPASMQRPPGRIAARLGPGQATPPPVERREAQAAVSPTQAKSRVSGREERSSDGSRTLVHETTVAASPADVWTAVSTAEGWKTWAVPTAWLDGDLLETSYSRIARRGDDTTIRQQIILAVPERMIAFRTIKAPKGFPNFESFRKTTHWIELEPWGEDRTRVRLVSAGYPDDPSGRQLADFFMKGNHLSLERLGHRFERGPLDWNAR